MLKDDRMEENVIKCNGEGTKSATKCQKLSSPSSSLGGKELFLGVSSYFLNTNRENESVGSPYLDDGLRSQRSLSEKRRLEKNNVILGTMKVCKRTP